MSELEFDDLNAMLRSSGQAWEYYSSLPNDVRDHICSQASSVRTFSSLRDYGESFLSRLK